MKATALTLGVVTLASAPFIGMATAQAASAPKTVYVATNGNSRANDHSCNTAAFSSINKAIGAVANGGTVIVCGGTYKQDVAVNKAVSVVGRDGATIDATKLINGFLVTADKATVSGFTVENAVGEGILVQNAKNDTVTHNTVQNNDQGVSLTKPVKNTYAFCQPQGGMMNDCGEGIHLEHATKTLVRGNTVLGNAGGILLTDETGPTSLNIVSNNKVGDNHTACGIVLAGHNPAAAPGGKPAPKVAGVFSNTVSGNDVFSNGLQGTGGAGVQLATGAPGGAVYNNTVTRNVIDGNGHSGITSHSHAPGQDLNGNVLTDNVIGTNNLNGDHDFGPDTDTTGILVGTVAPLKITISGNIIASDHTGIFTAGPVTVAKEKNNTFLEVPVPVSAN